jgi:DNA-binding transcriptional LysR family regulator
MDDWDDLRFALAVARAGSLAAAAASLRVDATTVGRRVGALEERLGPLFVRQRGAWRPTPAGAQVIAAATEIEARVAEVASAARAQEAAGRVHLTTLEAVAIYFVAPLLPAIAARHPRIEVVVSTTPVMLDLASGEADLAIRLGDAGPSDRVARRLGEIGEIPYAARAWLAARGLDEGITHLDGAPIVVTPLTGQRAALARAGGGPVVLRTASTGTAIEAVASGIGVGILPTRLAASDPRLVPLEGLGIRRSWKLWLVFREEIGRTPAVRAVVDALVEGLDPDAT